MSQITSFDKTNLKQLRESIQKSLDAVAEQYGLQSIRLGNIRFDSNSFSSKIDAHTKNSKPALVKVDMPIGSGKVELGAKKQIKNHMFTIVDLKLNRPKYQIIAQNQNGTRYKLTVDQWNNGF